MTVAPRFERTADSPELPGEGEALVMRVPQSAAWSERTPLVVSGAFQAGPALEGVANGDPFAALTILVVHGPSRLGVIVRPMADAVALVPEPGPGGTARGWFTADVFALAKHRAQRGTHYVSAYLGALQSAPVAVEIA